MSSPFPRQRVISIPSLPLYGPLRHRFREKPKQDEPNQTSTTRSVASSKKEDRVDHSAVLRHPGGASCSTASPDEPAAPPSARVDYASVDDGVDSNEPDAFESRNPQSDDYHHYHDILPQREDDTLSLPPRDGNGVDLGSVGSSGAPSNNYWSGTPSLVLTDFPPGMTAVAIHIKIDNNPSTPERAEPQQIDELSDDSSDVDPNEPEERIRSCSGSETTVKTGTTLKSRCEQRDAVKGIGRGERNRRQIKKSTEPKMEEYPAMKLSSAVTSLKQGFGRNPPIASEDSTTSCSTPSTEQTPDEFTRADFRLSPPVKSESTEQALNETQASGKYVPMANTSFKEKKVTRRRSKFPRARMRKKSMVFEGELSLDRSKSIEVNPLPSLGVDGGGVNQATVDQSKSNSLSTTVAAGLLDSAAEQCQLSSSATQLSVTGAACAPTSQDSVVDVNDDKTNTFTPATTINESVAPSCYCVEAIDELIDMTFGTSREPGKNQEELVSVPVKDQCAESDLSMQNGCSNPYSKKQITSNTDSTNQSVAAPQGNEHHLAATKEQVSDIVMTKQLVSESQGEPSIKETQSSFSCESDFGENTYVTEIDEASTRSAETTLSKVELALHHLEKQVAPHNALVQAEISSLKTSKLDVSCFPKLAYASLLETVKANIAEMKAVTSKRTKQRKLVDSENSLEEKMDEYLNLVEKGTREQIKLERTLTQLLRRIEKGAPPTYEC